MTEDDDRHREIREQIVKAFKGKVSIYTSHTGIDGHIAFYNDAVANYSALSFPDVLIAHNGRVLIIEIENDNAPKTMFGDAYANYHGNIAEQNKGPIDISRKSLLIVVPSEKIKEKSSKPRQFALIKELVGKHINYEYFNIVTELEVDDAIMRWLEG
jgi:putative NIF3 family GTP cyclohydrolase 1 type 2